MYLYYDRYGTLKEQITFNPARVGNSNVNKIFVYWEGVEEFPDWAQELALQTRYLLQDNTQYPSATTFGFSAQPETAELPFDKNQDLKYFKYYKEYKFLTIDIPDEVLSYNGAVKSYIWVLNADKKRILGLGVFAFMVDGDINEVIPDENISLAQWNMISAQLGLLSGSVIDVTCDIETNTLRVYYANGLTAIRNLPPNGAQATIISDFLREMSFSADTWVQDGENGYYIYFRAETVGYNDNRFFVQLERDGEYVSDYYSKTGSFVLSDNIFKGSDGSVLLYSNEPYSGRLLVAGGELLSNAILVTGLTYNPLNSQLTYETTDGITHTIYLGINEKFDKSDITQTTGDSTVKVMSQDAVTKQLTLLNSSISANSAQIAANREAVENKFDKIGGVINGSVVITENLNVKGKVIASEEITQIVKDAVIILNSDGADLSTTLAGTVIRINDSDTNNAYAIAYDKSTDSVKLGIGTVTEIGVGGDRKYSFAFAENEGNPIAVRNDSSLLTNNRLLKWDSTNNKIVDSGKTADNFLQVSDASGTKLVNDPVAFISRVDFDALLYSQTGILIGGNGDLTFTYDTVDTKIVPDTTAVSDVKTFTQTLPRQTGTFLLRPNDLPTETSLVTVSSTGTSAYKKLSELVDTTSEQTITGTKNFESTGKNYCITCQTIINGVTYTAKLSGGELLFINDGGSENVQANYSINGVYSRHRTSSSSGLLKLPIDLEGTFAITPNAAPTEPSVVVNAVDRTPTWKPVSELGGNALKVTIW